MRCGLQGVTSVDRTCLSGPYNGARSDWDQGRFQAGLVTLGSLPAGRQVWQDVVHWGVGDP